MRIIEDSAVPGGTEPGGAAGVEPAGAAPVGVGPGIAGVGIAAGAGAAAGHGPGIAGVGIVVGVGAGAAGAGRRLLEWRLLGVIRGGGPITPIMAMAITLITAMVMATRTATDWQPLQRLPSR
jgi:hypothetical protein